MSVFEERLTVFKSAALSPFVQFVASHPSLGRQAFCPIFACRHLEQLNILLPLNAVKQHFCLFEAH